MEATIAIGGERTTLRRTSTDLWMVGEQPMDEAHAKDWSLFIAQLVEPEVREWVEADDQRYEAFGLTDADQPIKLIIRLTREGRSIRSLHGGWASRTRRHVLRRKRGRDWACGMQGVA